MPDDHFIVPLAIETDVVGRYRVVQSSTEAAEMLLYRWPEEARGDKYWAALRACKQAMEGKKRATAARAAFIEAATEANLYVRDPA